MEAWIGRIKGILSWVWFLFKCVREKKDYSIKHEHCTNLCCKKSKTQTSSIQSNFLLKHTQWEHANKKNLICILKFNVTFRIQKSLRIRHKIIYIFLQKLKSRMNQIKQLHVETRHQKQNRSTDFSIHKRQKEQAYF